MIDDRRAAKFSTAKYRYYIIKTVEKHSLKKTLAPSRVRDRNEACRSAAKEPARNLSLLTLILRGIQFVSSAAENWSTS